jgi:hypothetical protein
MASIEDIYKRLIAGYPRAIVHMRSQVCSNRFSLIFGAGLNVPFRLPNWSDLVQEIAQDPAVNGEKILARIPSPGSEPYKTELLFQHFRTQRGAVATDPKAGSPEFENMTLANWFEICCRHLYEKAPADFPAALAGHPFLSKYLPIVKRTPITVTYNFDDYIEQALLASKDAGDTTLGYETVTNPWTQFRRSHAVIYHPHGVLPKELMEFPQDRLVFSESSYARLMLGGLAGDFTFLLNLMSKNTCLIVGSSLADEDLRSVFIQSARSNPGNPHYYVCYLKPGEVISEQERDAIRKANFHVYNLITLFLNGEEIAGLGDLLHGGAIDDDCFIDLMAEVDRRPCYRFYLTGAISVGKSTTANQLRNLTVLDEWAEPRLPLLAKPWDTLRPEEMETCDSWIDKQFKIKNDKLRHEKFGIALIDRPPMDPLAFKSVAERPSKAKALLNTICPGGKWEVVDGTVIFLRGDPKELAARVLVTGRPGYDKDKLKKMEEDLDTIYKGEGVRVIDTRGMSIADVAKRVSEIIHIDEYRPFEIDAALKNSK